MAREGIGCKEDCQEDCGILEDRNMRIMELTEEIETLKNIHEENQILQQENECLQSQITGMSGILSELREKITNARQGAFGFMIKADETLQEGMVRNYQEFFEERARLGNQVFYLKEIIVNRQMAKLCWCDKCSEGRDPKKYRERLLQDLNSLVAVKEAQNDEKKTATTEVRGNHQD